MTHQQFLDALVFAAVPVYLSYIWIATAVPPKLRLYLSRRRTHWVKHCQAAYEEALHSLQEGDRSTAEKLLRRVQRWQSKWEERQTWAAAAQRAFWVISGVSLACLVVRLSPLILISYVSHDTGLLKLVPQYEFIIWLSIPTLIILWNYFALSYDEEAPFVVDFADRLGRALHAGQEVIEGRYFLNLDDVSELRDLFGLPPNFTVHELDKARRRLAAELHLDRWQDLEARARQAREEALKNINAAYERLSPLAR